MRDFWNKNRALSLTERWYRTLRDDSSGYARWLEAAAHIVQPSDQPGLAVQGVHIRALEPNAAPMKGEELRSRRDPSVSELLARRALEIALAPRPADDPERRAGESLRVGAPARPLGSESRPARDPDADDPGPRVRRPGSLRRLRPDLHPDGIHRAVHPDPRRGWRAGGPRRVCGRDPQVGPGEGPTSQP